MIPLRGKEQPPLHFFRRQSTPQGLAKLIEYTHSKLLYPEGVSLSALALLSEQPTCFAVPLTPLGSETQPLHYLLPLTAILPFELAKLILRRPDVNRRLKEAYEMKGA